MWVHCAVAMQCLRVPVERSQFAWLCEAAAAAAAWQVSVWIVFEPVRRELDRARSCSKVAAALLG